MSPCPDVRTRRGGPRGSSFLRSGAAVCRGQAGGIPDRHLANAGFASQFRWVPRRFVPRRISFPVLTQAAAELGAGALRVRRPVLFPGAAYDIDAGLTGVRGRVVQGAAAVRWARVAATLPGGTRVVGRGHGDDRGEFLLLLSPAAGSVGELVDPFAVRITVTCRPAAPVPDSPDRVVRDALVGLAG